MERGANISSYLGQEEVDRLILAECYRVANGSPDTSTQIGACITEAHPSGKIIPHSWAFNGFVRGWTPTEADFERPRKYLVTAHAERRAIYQSVRWGQQIKGGTLYSTWAACTDCAIAMVEVGIACLVRHHPPHDEAVDRWLESVALGDEILKAGGVEIVDIHGPILGARPILRGGELFDPSV